MSRITEILVLFLVSISISGCFKSVPESSFDCSQLNSARAGSEDFSYSGIIEITIQQMSPYYSGDENIDLFFRKRLPWDNAEGKITEAIFLEKLEGHCAQNPSDDMVEAGIESILELESEISTRPDLAPCYLYNETLDIDALIEFHRELLHKNDDNPDYIHSGRLLDYIQEGEYSREYFDAKVSEFCQAYQVSPIFYGLVDSIKTVEKIKKAERERLYKEAVQKREVEKRREAEAAAEAKMVRLTNEMNVLLRKYDHDLFSDGDVSCEGFKSQFDAAQDYIEFKLSGFNSEKMISRAEYLDGLNATLETLQTKLSADNLEMLQLARSGHYLRANPFTETHPGAYLLVFSGFSDAVYDACGKANDGTLSSTKLEEVVMEYADKRLFIERWP